MNPVATIIFKKIQKKLTKTCGFTVDSARFQINYLDDLFVLTASGVPDKNFTKFSKVTDYSDFSDILLAKIKAAIKLKSIHKIDLIINFNSKSQESTVFGVNMNDNKIKETISNLF